MTQRKRQWVVLGPGAVSGLIASGLIDQGESVSIIPRHVTSTNRHWQLAREQTKTNYTAPFVQPPIDNKNTVVIAAVKAFDVVEALQHITKLAGFHRTTPIVLSHNGMVTLPASLQGLNLHHLVTTHGAVKSQDQSGKICIEHRGLGRSWLEAKQQTADLGQWTILQQAFPPLILEHDISQRRWVKLIINSVINPMTALHQCANGELLRRGWESQIYALVDEAAAVAKSQGIPVTVDDCYQEVIRVAHETALNHSSMLQDVRHQRRTEIQQLTGYLISAGESAGISIPTHQKLLNEFQHLYGNN